MCRTYSPAAIPNLRIVMKAELVFVAAAICPPQTGTISHLSSPDRHHQSFVLPRQAPSVICPPQTGTISHLSSPDRHHQSLVLPRLSLMTDGGYLGRTNTRKCFHLPSIALTIISVYYVNANRSKNEGRPVNEALTNCLGREKWLYKSHFLCQQHFHHRQ